MGQPKGRTAKAKKHKRAEEVTDPRWIFWGLILITVVLAAILGLFVDRNVMEHSERIEWWKIIISGASLAISLFLGSIVAIQAYQYVNRLSHDWKIRHDYAVDRLDRLYGPLWDEAKCIIEALEKYYSSGFFVRIGDYNPGSSSTRNDALRIQKFEQLTMSHLRLFLTKPVMEQLQAFHKSVLEYDRLRDEIREEMAAEFKKYISSHESLAHAKDKRDNAADYMWNDVAYSGDSFGALLNSQPDPQTELEVTRRHANYLKNNLSVSESVGISIISDGLQLLKNNARIEELRKIRKDSINKGKALLSALQDIIKKPELALE